MAANAVNGSVPTDPPPYLHNQILDASRIPPARGDLSAGRQTLNEPALANLSDRERLTGYAHPDDLCGSLAHDLGTRHSNTFLTNSIRVLYYAVSGTYNTSNYIVARVNEPRKKLGLTATARPKARSARDTPPMQVFVLMDQGQHAGQWMRIVIGQTGFNVSTMTPAQIQSENLNARLTTLRTSPGALPALPARIPVQQGTQPSVATGQVVPPTAIVSTHPATIHASTSLQTIASANSIGLSLPIQQQASGPVASTQHPVLQHSAPSVQSATSNGLSLGQQNFQQPPSSSSTHASFSTPASVPHLSANGTFTGNTQNSDNSAPTGDDEGSSSDSTAPHPLVNTLSIAQTHPTLSAVQARKRRINENEDEEAPKVSSPKRARKDYGPVTAVTPLVGPIPRRIAPLSTRNTRRVEAMNPLLLDPQLGGSTQAPRMSPVPCISKRAARRQRAQAHATNSNAYLDEASDRVNQISAVALGEVGRRYTYALPSHEVHLDNPLYVVVPHVVQAGFEQNKPE